MLRQDAGEADFCLVLAHTQGEKKLLLDVEEAQNTLTAVKNQLLLKTSQVADAKAVLDHKSRSIQKINKCLSNYC